MDSESVPVFLHLISLGYQFLFIFLCSADGHYVNFQMNRNLPRDIEQVFAQCKYNFVTVSIFFDVQFFFQFFYLCLTVTRNAFQIGLVVPKCSFWLNSEIKSPAAISTKLAPRGVSATETKEKWFRGANNCWHKESLSVARLLSWPPTNARISKRRAVQNVTRTHYRGIPLGDYFFLAFEFGFAPDARGPRCVKQIVKPHRERRISTHRPKCCRGIHLHERDEGKGCFRDSS